MDRISRIYHLTAEGRQARALGASGLPPAVRELLASVDAATCFGELPAEVRARLEDLEAIGLVESVSAEWLAELLAL